MTRSIETISSTLAALLATVDTYSVGEHQCLTNLAASAGAAGDAVVAAAASAAAGYLVGGDAPTADEVEVLADCLTDQIAAS